MASPPTRLLRPTCRVFLLLLATGLLTTGCVRFGFDDQDAKTDASIVGDAPADQSTEGADAHHLADIPFEAGPDGFGDEAAIDGGSPTERWHKELGSGDADYGHAIAIDRAGNLFITGSFWRTVDFGGGPLTSAHIDIYMASYAPDGSYRWAKSFGGSSSDSGNDIAVDESGNVFVTGFFRETVDFGDGAHVADADDIFVASFTNDGAIRWSKRFGGPEHETGIGIATDGRDTLTLLCLATSTLDLGGGPLPAASNGDICLANLALSDGAHQWSNIYGGAGYDLGNSVAMNRNGTVAVTGSFESSIHFGASELVSADGADIFFAVFDADGGPLHSAAFGSTWDDKGTAIVIAADNTITFGGTFFDSINLGGATFTNDSGTNDTFLASFDAAGQHRWSHNVDGSASEWLNGLALEDNGDLTVVGGFDASVSFGGDLLTSAGRVDGYAARFDTNGQHLWSLRYGGAGTDMGSDVVVQSNGAITIIGEFQETVDLGSGPLTSAGSFDILLWRLSP